MSDRPVPIRKALGACVVALILFSSLHFSLTRYLGQERSVRLSIERTGSQCVARIDGGDSISVDLPGPPMNESVGLYTYHPVEFPSAVQHFSGLNIEAPAAGGSKVERSLTAGAKDLDLFENAPGWMAEEGQGIRHVASGLGDRAVAFLRQRMEGAYRISVVLQQPMDSGILIRSDETQPDLVLVVREIYNDVFFFRMDRGMPGPILAFMPLSPITMSSEAARLLALIASIGTSCGLFLAALLGLMLGVASFDLHRLPFSSRALPGLPVLMAALLFAAMASVATWSLDRTPHIPDETAYVFQAKIFAGNRLWVPPPPMPEFFTHPHILVSPGRWSSKYPPMWSVLLSLGTRLDLTWMVDPVLGALTGILMFLLARGLAGRGAGILALLFALTSPFFVLMGACLMSHMAAALFVTGFVLFALRGKESQRSRDFFLSGSCLGATVLTRPYEAALVLLPVGLYLIVNFLRIKNRPKPFHLVLFFCLGAYPFLVGYFAWNMMQSPDGQIVLSLHGVNFATDQLGFGEDKGMGWLKTWGTWGHTPAKGLRSVSLYLQHTSDYLLGWPGRLSFCFVPLALFLRGRRAEVILLFGLCGVLVAGHTAYWATQHLVYGARYWFAGVPFLLVLSALGVSVLMEMSRREEPDGTWGPPSFLPLLAAAALIAGNLCFYSPRMFAIGHDYGGISASLRNEVLARGLTRAVIFVKTEGDLFNDGFHLNDPLRREGPVFARDLGERNPTLLQHFPGYEAYLWDKTSLTPLPVPSGRTDE